MGVFDDKKFEELDWISQATEPIDSKLNEVLGLIPDFITIDFETFKQIAVKGYGIDLSIEAALNYTAQKYANTQITWDQIQVLKELFKFEIEGDEQVILNFETGQLIGNLKFVKLANTMDEKVLEGLLGKEGVNIVSTMALPTDCLPRLNEVMELLGKCEGGLRTRSERKKRGAIRERLISIFKTNEWKIRDTELANKVGYWIAGYITTGNLASFSNFCRLKVMTHKEQPIYSMEEVQ